MDLVFLRNHWMLLSDSLTAGQSTLCKWFIWILFKSCPLLAFQQFLSCVNSWQFCVFQEDCRKMVSSRMIAYWADELSQVYVRAHLPVWSRLPALCHFLSSGQAGKRTAHAASSFCLTFLECYFTHTHLKVCISFCKCNFNLILFWQQIPLLQNLFILYPTIFIVEAEIQHVSWRRAVWGKLGAHTSRLDPTKVWIVLKIRNV